MQLTSELEALQALGIPSCTPNWGGQGIANQHFVFDGAGASNNAWENVGLTSICNTALLTKSAKTAHYRHKLAQLQNRIKQRKGGKFLNHLQFSFFQRLLA
ncbi:hypothetical protein ACMYR3_03225 [Ampullimonas aquatilis]|uniref:hypothetical protein n=1 Tax=Ampullimonas aquatilis TaxID=1341549 RepID=UPI003C709EF1